MRNTFGLISGLWLGALAVLPASALPASALPAWAMPLAPPSVPEPAVVIPVAQGCGPGWWRGPWGHCRDTPYSGRVPGGGWVYDLPPTYGYFGNGCPPGYWHGPWGHCRDTPYHGRLPGGGWQ